MLHCPSVVKPQNNQPTVFCRSIPSCSTKKKEQRCTKKEKGKRKGLRVQIELGRAISTVLGGIGTSTSKCN